MKTITVNVTQEHIDRGVPTDVTNCPVAIAAHEACPLADFIIGVLDYLMKPITTEAWPHRCTDRGRLPLEASMLAWDFDQKLPVNPTTFKLQVPDWAVAEEPVRSVMPAPPKSVQPLPRLDLEYVWGAK